MASDTIIAASDGKTIWIPSAGEIQSIRKNRNGTVLGTATLLDGHPVNFRPLKSFIPKPASTRYEKGLSCPMMSKEHVWADLGNYFKCGNCGSSKTKPKVTAERKAGSVKANVTEAVRKMWPHIVANYDPNRDYTCNGIPATPYPASSREPEIIISRRLYGRTLASTVVSADPRYIEFWTGIRKYTKLRTIAHELLHVRGFPHGEVKGHDFPTDEGLDKIAEIVCTELGLNPVEIISLI